MPNGTGHACADCAMESSNRTDYTLFTSVNTILGGNMEIALGIAEAVEWFEQF